MTKEEFKELCQTEFVKRGFCKRKSCYYLLGVDGLLGGLHLQSSCGGKAYYVNIYFYLDGVSDTKKYPACHEADLHGRINVWSRATYKGQHFMSSLIEFEKYSQEELFNYITDDLDSIVMPPLLYGRRMLRDCLTRLHIHPDRDSGEVMRKIRT